MNDEQLTHDELQHLLEYAKGYSSRADDCGRLARKVLSEALKLQAAEIERLRADAERYIHTCRMDWKDRDWVENFAEYKRQRDAAIDAAMRQGEKT